ncbi:MAG: Mth938-like domain-containing protein [Stellaceae bacterium]
MRIDRSQFGTITIDGTTYDHDVLIGLSGEVSKRKKKLSKQQYGTSHLVSKAEAKFVFEEGCDLIIIGSGQEGNVRLSPEAEDYFAKKGCDVLLQPTQKAIRSFNRSAKRKIALMHVTC